ncbi:MAG: 2-deoxy-D-gluconate 3-dehydrogenase [Pseudanabaena sp.]|nr:MAG: 2-deoxy-D-gluconate 3-dehydrogenase [Pseudanabaena sp.]
MGLDIFSLQDYVVIITGAGGAIGGATAQVLAEAGANVVLSDLNGDAAKQRADEITAATGKETLAIKTDVTDEAQLQELVDATLNKFGKITALVNNVGWGEYTPLWGVTTDYMVKSYILNTVSSYNLTKLCMPHLKKQPNASVTFSGSMVGVTPSPEFISYSNAKAALVNMVRSIAAMSGPEVRCNTIVIGSVDNGAATLDAGYDEAMLKRLADAFVMKRRGVPLDIAYAYNYLISPAASWVTGIELRVDGGGSYKSKMPTSDDN